MRTREDGVSPSVVALPAGHWTSMLDFLDERFPHVGRDVLLARLARGDVRDAAGAAVTPDARYRPHAKLYYYRDVPDEAPLPVEEDILFHDEWIVAVDKPHFLPMSPGGRHLRETLVARLKRRLGIDTLAPIHRLDRETAGVVLFSVQPDTRGAYQRLFAERAVEKHYEAIAPSALLLSFPLLRRSRLAPATHFMQMTETDGPANSETVIDCVEVRDDWARYRLIPRTGKKHQLRVHMAALGLPIRHDRLYPTLSPADAPDDYSQPLQLLARSIAFADPFTGTTRRFESRRHLQW